MTKPDRFVVLGTGGLFTYQVLQTLIKESVQPVAYIQSGGSPLQVQSSFANIELEINKSRDAVVQLISAENIPVFFESEIELHQQIRKLKADFLLVACWPKLLPVEVLNAVSKKALNLHPSLLPKYRGVDPIGDQLLVKDYNFGITLHLLDNQLDTGDIVLQKAMKLDSQYNRNDITRQTAQSGAQLFIKAIRTYSASGWVLTKQIE